MAAITVRGLDDDVRHRLKIRAARNNRSMEAEVRAILERAVATDVEEPAGAGAPGAGDQVAQRIRQVLQATGLTPREEAVVVHIAEGLTNRQIAARLYLSERTVEAHVGSVLRKLGFASRAGIAGWYAAMSTSALP